MIVALRIGCDGRKTLLGLREGALENQTAKDPNLFVLAINVSLSRFHGSLSTSDVTRYQAFG